MSPRHLVRALPIGLTLVATMASAAPPPRDAAPGARGIVALRTGTAPVQAALSRGSAWRAFTARHGEWSVTWNELTGTPHRAFGRGIALPGFAEEPAAVDAAVRRFIAENDALLGSPRDLELLSSVPAGNLWYVRYRPRLGGIPVLFSNLEFRVARNGRLVMFGADGHTPPASLLARPRVGGAVAREAAKSGVDFDAARDRVEGGERLYVVPMAGEAGVEYRLAYEVRVQTRAPRHHWITLVDAATTEVLWRHDHVFRSSTRGQKVLRDATPAPAASAPVAAQPEATAQPETITQPEATMSGLVWGRVHANFPYDSPLATLPFPKQRVTVGANQVVSDANGIYTDPSCAGSVNVTARLAGPFCHVERVDTPTTFAWFSRSWTCATSSRDILWDTSNSQHSERDAFYHTVRAHTYIKTLDPAYTASDRDVVLGVNSIDDECVAYWDGISIVYGDLGTFCPYPMSTMADIVYREYCQRVNDDLYFAHGAPFGLTNEALHSATADAMAAFMTNDPKIGDGIEGQGTFLRTVDNGFRWPEDDSADGNQTGLILAGAFWDLKESVGLPVAERLLHFAKYGTPGETPTATDDGAAMSDYFIETLVADDDDADISNGTPHSAQIIAAFNAHGIGTINYLTINHAPLGDQLANGPYPITAVIQYSGPIGALDASSPRLYYSINNLPYEAQVMTPTGNPDEWGGELPAASGAIVRYYVSAAETFGGIQTEPPGAPSREHYLFIAGPASTVLSVDMESNPGWIVSASSGSVTGLWTRVDPNTDGLAAPEDDHTDIGTMCYVTGQAPVGAQPGTNDVDNGSTTLTTSTFNPLAGGMTFPIVSYYRWFSNNQGDAGGEDPWVVQISNNGGGSWVTVENTTDSDASWRRVLFFIKDYVTPTTNMKMRFIAADNGLGSLVEAGVDDFTLLGFSGLTGVDDAAGGSLALAAPTPNPFRGATRVRYSLPRAGHVELVAYDIHGRVVRRLIDRALEAGEHGATWDGRDDGGRPVASGPYFLRLSQNGERASGAVVRIR